MMLQALNSYYERMSTDDNAEMPAFGVSVENISFALVLGEDGSLRDLEDLRELNGKQMRPRKIQVPVPEKKANGIKPNFLWDTTSYVLGIDDKGNQERTDKCHTAFIEHVKKYCDAADVGLKAVIAFLESEVGTSIGSREDWSEICGSNLVFRLDGIPGFIHDRPAARNAWEKCVAQRGADSLGQCLVTGEVGQPLARLHSSIKGVRGARSGGASLVSFNKKSFESYGKEQSFNSPTSQKVAFAYTTALNFLLSTNSRQKLTIGDTTYVFWAKRASMGEEFLADLFDLSNEAKGQTTEQNDQVTTSKVHGLLKAICDGRKPTDFIPDLDEDVQFYILGLAPNAARLSIRFWQESRLGDLLEKVGRHYQQLNIVRQFDNEPEFPPLWRLLCQTASLGKTENISPVLAGGMIRAMLTGSPYPQNLLPVVLERIRAEHDVTYFRAALLKAYLLRNTKLEEVPVSFDPDRTDLPYLLGRLFAVLEKAQEEAIPGANATIKDRYLSSASATPGQVFHMLLKNSANHLAKVKKDSERRGRAIYYETMIQDVIAKFDDYPKTQNAEEQGLFMIGYYHQRKDFYTKKTQEG